MNNFWKEVYARIGLGQDVVIATIVAARGSVPRGSGARMLVGTSGRLLGTVGGGAVEHECINIAIDMIGRRSSICQRFVLDQNDIADIGMVCGGDVDVLFQYVSHDDNALSDLFKKLSDNVISHKPCHLIMAFSDDTSPVLSVYDADETIAGSQIDDEVISNLNGSSNILTRTINGKSIKYYSEQIVSPETVYIFGGGHVAQQLVPTLARCDFHCVVIEDRPEYADSCLFEDKCDIILVREGEISNSLPNITENDYVCIMTRGHKDDYRVQRAVLKSKAHYIGVIGSRRKIASVNERLKEDGFTQADIDRITAPIGIDIMSETPAEIAVSVAAQLIKVRAIRNGGK